MILGGTQDARIQAVELAGQNPEINYIYSLAGITDKPQLPLAENITHHIGGFGGVEGMVDYCKTNDIAQIWLLTHVFADNIAKNAKKCAEICQIPLNEMHRPSWGLTQYEINAQDLVRQANLINGNILFALGGHKLMPLLHGLKNANGIFRMINPIIFPKNIPYKEIIISPPLDYQGECEFIIKKNISALFARDSGGEKGFQKIKAAIDNNCQVFIIKRNTNI